MHFIHVWKQHLIFLWSLCILTPFQAHHFSSFLSFTLPLQLIHLEQNPAHFFFCQSNWSAQCSLRVTFFFFPWSVVNWISPLPSSIAIDSHFSEAVSPPQHAERLHKLNSSCARARPKTEPQASWNASQCVKQLSTQPACPVLQLHPHCDHLVGLSVSDLLLPSWNALIQYNNESTTITLYSILLV